MVHGLSDKLPFRDEVTKVLPKGRQALADGGLWKTTCRHLVDGTAADRVAPKVTGPGQASVAWYFRYHFCTLPLPERALIDRIRRLTQPRLRDPSRLSKGGSSVIVGIGDDASVLRGQNDHEILVTTDLSLEGVHFHQEWHPPESVGHRCLARGLSDIAAMGGDPIAAFLSLAVPGKLLQKWVDQFLSGLLQLASQFDVALAGGDTSESPGGILAGIVVVGTISEGPAARKGGKKRGTQHWKRGTRRGKLGTGGILRSGARPGDRIYVTGELGGSAATLDLLRSRPKKKLKPKLFPKHFFPAPRVDVGRILREKGIATSMIDISDGLSTDLAHLCDESGTGAEIWQDAIPLASIGRPPHKVGIDLALHGGEDYELLFTAAHGTQVPAEIAGVQITEIGYMTRTASRILRRSGARAVVFDPQGWEHFRS